MSRLTQAEFFRGLNLSPDPMLQTPYVEPRYDLIDIHPRQLDQRRKRLRLDLLIRQGLDIERRSYPPGDALSFTELRACMPEDQSVAIVRGHVYVNSQAVQLASMTSMLLQAYRYGKMRLQYELPGDMAFNNGTSVHPAHRGKGLQKDGTRDRREHAQLCGKSATVVPVAPGNIPSFKSQLDFDPNTPGFVAVAISDHNRLIMVDDYRVTTKIRPSQADVETNFIPLPNVKQAIGQQPSVALPVNYDLTPNYEYNSAASKLFNAGYLGVACMALSTPFAEYAEATNATIFTHVDALPSDMQVLQERQTTIQALI